MRSLRLEERVELLPAGSPAAALGAALIGAARDRGGSRPWLKSSSSRMPRPPARSSPTRSAAWSQADPDAVLGLATGSTPLPVYEALPARLAGLDVSRVRGFALDEYVGHRPRPSRELPQSVITREVVEPLGLDPARVRVPDGSLEGIEHAGEDYEARARGSGGVDLQILGIGTDGHIGFNEPGSSFASLHPRQDPDPADPRRQRAVLRLDRRRARCTASRRGSARSCAPGTSCCSRSARARPRPSRLPSRAR